MVIGRVVEGSPADRIGVLRVGDRILSINDVDITSLSHEEIVQIVKHSGTTLTLTIGAPHTGLSCLSVCVYVCLSVLLVVSLCVYLCLMVSLWMSVLVCLCPRLFF